MTKRRRERDRPKAGPDSLYNPNKRVHLSYADSDEEDAGSSEIQPVEDPRMTKLDDRRDLAGGHVVPPSYGAQKDEQQESLAQDDDNEEYEPGGDVEETAETGQATEQTRQSSENRVWEPSRARQQSKRNTEAIGCLQFPDDDDGGDDEDSEVVKYMRAVQSQRKDIPQILYAAVEPEEDDGERRNGYYPDGDSDDHEAGYEDGAFFARSTRSAIPVIEVDTLDPRTVFTDRLIQRFHTQRTTLHIPATMDELTSLSDDILISFPSHNKAARSHWLRTLPTQPPLPAQIRSIDQPTALNLLEAIADSILIKATDVNVITSAWIWSLLARLDDVSNLYNDEIFPLRQLGKKALFVLLSFKDPEAARGIEALDDDDDDRGSPGPPPGSADSAPDESNIGPTSNTLATLAMILTIVGQVFGQKDLLQFRQTWEAAEG